MTAEELLERYAAGERDFQEIQVIDGSFIQACLRNINLSGSKLLLCSFIAADMDGAQLNGTIFDGSDLTRTTLRQANLQGAILGDVQMIGTNGLKADFSRAQLYRANLDGASFRNANFFGADLGSTSLIGTSFYGANLRDVNLDQAIGNADFTKANLSGALIPELESRLKGSIFSETIWQ